MTGAVLEIDNLRVAFGGREVVHGVSLAVNAGEKVALVGESGSGKSVTALAAMGLLAKGGRVTGGAIRLDGRDILGLSAAEWRTIRGPRMAMVFQDPGTALNPSFSIGRQIIDVLTAHRALDRTAAVAEEAAALLTSVGIADATTRLRLYPHELSGGMKQRVLIAMAAACQPRLLIADEPTTALDVTVQAQVISVLRDLCATRGIALLFISHNLDLVAEFCDRITVFYRGRTVEAARAEALFSAPRHPYTRMLLDAVARPGQPLRPLPAAPTHGVGGEGACDFAPRCPHAFAPCASRPTLRGSADHPVACSLEP